MVWMPPSRFCSDLPIFVIDCTGPDAFHFFSTKKGKSWGFAICMKGTTCENKYLDRERVDRSSLSDARIRLREMAETEINDGGKRVKGGVQDFC